MSQLLIVLPVEMPGVTGGAAVAGSQSLNYLVSADGRHIGNQSSAVPALLPVSIGMEVVALIPAQKLSWQQAQLPRGTLKTGVMADAAAPRLRAVLEGLLEEYLLDDAANLHFAIAPDATEAAPCAVGVCDRAWLKAWLQVLEQHQHTVQRIVPELAPGVEMLCVAGTAESPLLFWRKSTAKDPNSQAQSGGIASVAVLALDATAVSMVQWPADQELLAEPAVAALAEKLFGRRVSLQQNGQRWLAALNNPWDFAQFDLASSSGRRRWRRWGALASQFLQAPRWRAARWAVVALALVHVVGLNSLAWVERGRIQAKQQQVQNLLTQTFPQVKYVIDAPVQMRREVMALRQNAGYSGVADFENMLAVLGQLELPVGSTKELVFGQGELRLQGVKWSETEMATARKKLKAHGLDVTQQDNGLVLRAGGQP